MSDKSKIDLENLPKHVAIIMDGNGRWAKKKGKLRVFGHENGVKAVRDTVEAAADLGIEYLTLYAFSTENWNRPKYEITALMKLLVRSISKETKTLIENNIRLSAIGDLDSLPKDCRQELHETMKITEANSRMQLNLALSYSSRWEILEATKRIASEAKAGNLNEEDISEEVFSTYLDSADSPNPELLIRTSGEHRISNFLLWQIAYTELYFTDVLWPDFDETAMMLALEDYARRQRRYGMTQDQISGTKDA